MGVSRVPRLRIVTALLAALVVVSIVPLVLLTLNVTRINRDALETAEKKYLKNSSVGLAKKFETAITNAQAQLRRSPTACASRARCRRTPSTTCRRRSSCASTRTRTRASSSSGPLTATASAPSPSPAPSTSTSSARSARPTRPRCGARRTWASPFTGVLPEGGLVLAVPVRPADGQEPIGAVEALLSLAPLRAKLEEEGKSTGVLAYVVDRSGTLVLASDPAAFASRDIHQIDLVSEFIAHPVRMTKSYTRGGRRVLGTLAAMSTPDWGVVVEKEEAQAYASVAQTQRRRSSSPSSPSPSRPSSRSSRRGCSRTRSRSSSRRSGRSRAATSSSASPCAASGSSRSSPRRSTRCRTPSRSPSRSSSSPPRRTRSCSSTRSGRSRPRSTPRTRTRGATPSASRATPSSSRRHMGSRPEEVRIIRISALLHDVGKIGIDDRILKADGALGRGVRDHEDAPDQGRAHHGQIPQLKEVIPGIKSHHEKWTGGGYPDGLKGEGFRSWPASWRSATRSTP